ncbi:MAG: hypothetical protein ACRD0U_17555, partial [Acidimicrobiales bacterium]
MTVYYKATRPNGTDFWTGTVRYEPGETTRHPTSRRRHAGDASTYLSVSTVPTDCTGMAWPCRLFEVTGIGRSYRYTLYPNKRGFLAMHVERELPAHQVFGPQGEHVSQLLATCASLDEANCDRLGAAWVAARYPPRVAAWDGAWTVARTVARSAAWDGARTAARDTAGYA